MNSIFLWVVTLCYAGTAASYLVKGELHWAGFWGAYAFANWCYIQLHGGL
jgi:hypothetical protein